MIAVEVHLENAESRGVAARRLREIAEAVERGEYSASYEVAPGRPYDECVFVVDLEEPADWGT